MTGKPIFFPRLDGTTWRGFTTHTGIMCEIPVGSLITYIIDTETWLKLARRSIEHNHNLLIYRERDDREPYLSQEGEESTARLYYLPWNDVP